MNSNTEPFVAEKDWLGEAESGHSPWMNAWYRLRQNKMAVASALFLLVISSVCFVLPSFLEHGYMEQNLELRETPPSGDHWLGTDRLGRDMLARVMVGGRISLLVGLAATFVSLTIGVLYGTTAGYLGGKTDAVMMRLVDILYALPFLIFVILMMVFFGRDIRLIFLAIGAIEWLTMARIVRGQVMSIRKQEYIEACIALGLPVYKILFKHVAPNVLGPVIVYATLTVPAVMLLEAFLSFLGLGVQEPMCSWGSLIQEGSSFMEGAPWLILIPGFFFSVTLFSLNFLGDGLRDALDPRASKN